MLFSIVPTVVPVAGSNEVFQVRRIYCIGRNYAAHAREMGSDPTREPPFFFQKPTDAIQVVLPGKVADHPYPTLTKNYHYEVELVAALKSGGKNIPAAQGARPRLWLRRRPRHDAARSADRHARAEEAVGSGQGLRPRRAHRPDASGGEDRPFQQGRDLARGQRRGQAAVRSRQHDLERARADRKALARPSN